jgi:hypothetical protein
MTRHYCDNPKCGRELTDSSVKYEGRAVIHHVAYPLFVDCCDLNCLNRCLARWLEKISDLPRKEVDVNPPEN